MLKFGKHLFSVLYSNSKKYDVHLLPLYNSQNYLKILFNSEPIFHLPYLKSINKIFHKLFLYGSIGLWVAFGLLYTMSFHVHTF